MTDVSSLIAGGSVAVVDVDPVDAAAIADRIAAQAAAAAAAADVVLTHADVVLTHADVVLTHADAVATAADRVQTGQDRTATHADKLAADADATATAADRVQTGLDRVATGADRAAVASDKTATHADRLAADADAVATAADRAAVATNRTATDADAAATASDRTAVASDKTATHSDKLAADADVALTHADVVLTHGDVVSTAADRVQTGLDRIATAADRVQTGLDRVQTGLDKTSADATLSTVQALGSVIGYPNSAATNVPRGMLAGLVGAGGSVGAITAGTGGATVTNAAVTWTGGNWDANPSAIFSVSAGGMTAFAITGPGRYIGTSGAKVDPTPVFGASAGLTGAAVALTAQFLAASGAGYWVTSADGFSMNSFQNVAGVATARTDVGPLPTTLGVPRLAILEDAKDFGKQIYAAIGTGSIKALWDYKGPRTAYNNSGTILTELISLDPTPKTLGLHSFIFSGIDGRPVYDDDKGLYLSSQAGLQYTAGALLSKTTGNWLIAFSCGLNDTATVVATEAALPSSGIVEGNMSLVNADTNTTLTSDVKLVVNEQFTDSQLRNGYFRGVNLNQTQNRGSWYLFTLVASGGSYLRFYMNHIGQIYCIGYNTIAGITVLSLGTIIYGKGSLMIVLRRLGNQMSLTINGQQLDACDMSTFASMTDLTTLYINGNARFGTTAQPIGGAMRSHFKGLLVAEDVPEANFRDAHDIIAHRYGTPALFRPRRMRGFVIYGQSWTQGAIDCSADTWQSPTVNGAVWDGQITRNNLTASGEHNSVTRDPFPNWYAANSADNQVNFAAMADIGPISIGLNANGNQVTSHAPNSTGENFVMGMAAQINAHPEGSKDDYIISGTGAGGASVAVLSARSVEYLPTQLKNAVLASTDVYYMMLRQIIAARDFAYSRGQAYDVPVFVYQQGGSDAGSTTFFTDVQNLYIRFCTDVMAITGQSNKPLFFAPNISAGGIVGSTLRSITGSGTCLDQNWLDFEDNRTHATAGVLPMYCLGPMSQITNHIHPPRLGHRWIGEIFGRYIRRILFDGEAYSCMRPFAYTYAAAAATINVNYRVRTGRQVTFVDQNDNNIAFRRTLFGVDTYGYEFYRKILGTPQMDGITLVGNAITINGATGVVTCNAHGMVNGDKLFLTATTLPTGYTLLTEYFVINATTNTFGLSATSGGSQVVTSGSATGTIYAYDTTVKIASVAIPSATVTVSIASPTLITWVAHGLALNDKVQFTTTGALPTGMAANTDYYVSSVVSADTFRIAPNIGNVQVNATGSQSGVHTCTWANKVKITLDTNLAGSVGSMGILRYMGTLSPFGNLCDGAKVDGIYPYQDWTQTFVSNEPPFALGPVNDLRQWAAFSHKKL
jgi:hypothetical protein